MPSLPVSDLRAALALVRAVDAAATPAAARETLARGLGGLLGCERAVCVVAAREGVRAPGVHALSQGARHRACLTLPAGAGRVARVVLHRAGRPFGAAELALLEAVAPHVAPALRDPLAGAGLTEREREVLALVAEGRTNAQIAQRLGMRPRTAEKHLEHVLAKLGVPSRTAAAARYVESRIDGRGARPV